MLSQSCVPVAAYTASVAVAADPKPVSEWGKRASLADPNSEMAVAYLDGKIYVVGGYPSPERAWTPCRHTTSRRTVDAHHALSHPINHASAVGLDGVLYVIGGQTNAAAAG